MIGSDFGGFLNCKMFLKKFDPTEKMLLALGNLLTRSEAIFVKNVSNWSKTVLRSSQVSLSIFKTNLELSFDLFFIS